MSIDITIEEMEALPAESYELFDIRGEIERAHGILPNSTASSADALMENPPEDKEKKIIICCSRGQISRDIAEELQDQGYEAYSLKGGYVGWLMADMKKKEADDVCEHVELSIRKKFKKKIWSKFTKAVREYELVKEGDRIAVCISGGKDSMLMAKLFQELKRHNKFNFEVKFLVMDPGYSPENRKVIEENARKIYQYLETVLTKRERDIIRMRYGLPTHHRSQELTEITQREIAKKYGISRSYVSRIEKRALEKLREAYENDKSKT